jgi:carboxyl-terminal processing protease
MDYVLNTLVNQNFDYATDEYYDTDRDKANWANSKEDLTTSGARLSKARR